MAACFAVAHIIVQGRIILVLTFLPGLVLGWLFVRTKLLLAPILFHSIGQAGRMGFRAYPNNPLYPQGKPDACVVGEKMFSTWRKPLLASIFGLPPWPRTFHSAS
jgi:membrane protease YdiL (CAAX protease family)